MDIDLFIIAFGLIATGAIFFGYPLGLRHGSKHVRDEVCERLGRIVPANNFDLSDQEINEMVRTNRGGRYAE